MNSLLDKVNWPEDLHQLTYKEMALLSEEIREFLIDSVSKTGGHLASNLGVVELSIALHYVFSLKRDKLVWDVGHQSYIHKILTGRKDRMNTIRQMDGLSGFPKREESEYDIFDTGHSSTSISAAVGIARARDLQGDDYNVIALIGDGAMTGGMSFEALNDVGKNNTKLIVILNDNGMSISENVGGLSTHLSKKRTTAAYLNTKQDIGNLLVKIPRVGKYIKAFLRKIKEGIKKMILPSMYFEELGLTYLGPINGHDIEELVDVFERAKRIKEPVLIHVCTKKGMGYEFAEQNPDEYHGVSAFDIKTGEAINKTSTMSYSDMFGKKLCDLAQSNDKIIAISAAMIDGTGLCEFKEKFPKRIFDVGIAEQHAVTMAGGFAVNGMVPVIALYSSFLQRAYDQIVHDIATQNLHVVFAIDRAGIVGNDGETHQGVFDSGFLTQIPNMTVMAPADYNELSSMLDFAINKYSAPIAIRYPRGSSIANAPNSTKEIELGKGVIVSEGNDITIIAYGKMLEIAIETANKLKNEGINAEVINLRFIKPLDKELILKSVTKTKKTLIIEENSAEAGITNNIISILPKDINYLAKTFPDIFIKHGNVGQIYSKYGFDIDSIIKEVKSKLEI
jgi:1-deoxy-D-xylulose-5-phosphate synthase